MCMYVCMYIRILVNSVLWFEGGGRGDIPPLPSPSDDFPQPEVHKREGRRERERVGYTMKPCNMYCEEYYMGDIRFALDMVSSDCLQ